jgi:hypothetical protein
MQARQRFLPDPFPVDLSAIAVAEQPDDDWLDGYWALNRDSWSKDSWTAPPPFWHLLQERIPDSRAIERRGKQYLDVEHYDLAWVRRYYTTFVTDVAFLELCPGDVPIERRTEWLVTVKRRRDRAIKWYRSRLPVNHDHQLGFLDSALLQSEGAVNRECVCS